MKVVIEGDEWYPVYSLDTKVDEYNADQAVEIDEVFYERYHKCMTEFNAVQKLLDEMDKT